MDCRNHQKKIEYVRLLVGLYVAFSACEWFVHSQLMHNPFFEIGRRHMAHHREVLDDMSISRTSIELDDDVTRGTTLDVWNTWIVFAVGCGVALCVRRCIAPHTNLQATVVASIVAALYQTLTWNAIHPQMHGVTHDKMQARLLPVSALHSMVAHHKIHHLTTHHNYNITFPGGDIMFGTYRRRA